MSNPFDESDDDAEPFEKVDDLVINKSFADKFESQERRKDLLRAKELLDDDDESDSEVEDDEGELISASLDIEILKVINRIRKKDPKIYDKSTTWFEKPGESDEDDTDDNADEVKEDGSKSDKITKKKRYKDILREQLLTHGADIEHDDAVNDNRKSAVGRPTGALAYDEEQRKIRKAFLQSVGGEDDDDDEDDVFRVRAKNPAEVELEEIELKKAMSEMRELGVAEAVEETEKSDAFLLDYISKQSWKSKQKYSVKDEEADSSDDNYEEDEEELDKIDLFEHKYNFRFEELQGEKGADGEGSSRSNVIGMGLQSLQVTGHARNVEGSLRRVDEKRKTQREGRKVSKEKEKRQKEAELKRLKSLKNQELQERLRQICEVSGLGEGGLGLGEADLDEDWDPEKYEAMMQAQFGDEYYGDEDNGEFTHPEGGAEWDGDNQEGNGGDENEEEDYDEGNGEGENDDAEDYSSKKVNNSKVVSGMLDELYKLDYEDIIAGMPCRFKYRQVEKEDFGLSADEILLADDSELNKFVSLKKISAYSDPYGAGEQAQKVAKKRKRLRVAMKERLQKEAEDAEAAGMEIKGLKKKPSVAVSDEAVAAEEPAADEAGSKKRRRRKLKEGAKVVEPAPDQAVEMTVIQENLPKEKTEKKDEKLSKKKIEKAEDSVTKSEVPSKAGKADKSGKGDTSKDPSKKRKKSAMASAPVSRSGGGSSNGSSKPNGPSEALQRRANLYK